MSGIRASGQWRAAPVVATTLIVGVAGGLSLSSAAQAPPHERRVTLSGATNLRDLGGYKTADGRRVRWGLVYRSDQLAQLTDEDYQQLARFGIATVCDFRRDDERDRAPTKWRGDSPPEILVRVLARERWRCTARSRLDTEARRNRRRGRGGDACRLRLQRDGAGADLRHRPAAHHARPDTRPLHSGEGSDRHLQRALPADGRRAVCHGRRRLSVEQYLLRHRRAHCRSRAQLKTSIEAARALLAVDKSYLLAALNEIDDRYDSLDNYRRTQLGVSDAGLAELKARVLEP